MNLDFHPKMMDRSGLYSQSNVNLNNIFNEGDVSMMDEMNKLFSGLPTHKEFQAANKVRMTEGDQVTRKSGVFRGSESCATP
jgi:hypothetical protein